MAKAVSAVGGPPGNYRAGPTAADPYADFADRYDRFFADFGAHPGAKREFFAALFGRHRVKRVLDCACGTGRDLHLLHSLGMEVVGSDLSEAMLAQARRSLVEHGVTAPLHRLDYRRLEDCLGVEFDAVVCLASSLLHAGDRAAARSALESMRRVLRPGGLLVLSQGTADKQWAEKPRFILAADTPVLTRLFVVDYAGDGATYHVVDVDREGKEARLRWWSFEYPVMLLGGDYERLLPEAGFAGVSLIGSWAGEAYDPERSEMLIVVATAP